MADREQSDPAFNAASATEEQIAGLLHHPSPPVILALLQNRLLTEENILVIAGRKNLPPDVFTAITRDKRWSESYPIRCALAANPKTPLSVSLSLARYLRLFDLAEMARSPQIPLAFRHKIEAILLERVPTMALGLKKSLAKMAVGTVLQKLLQDPSRDVVALCLNNPRLLENHLYKAISRRDTSEETIRMIAGHPNWSLRPTIRYALARNERTPLVQVEQFLRSMKLLELRDLYIDPMLPASVKPLVYRELLSRGIDPKSRMEENIYEIEEDDDKGLETMGIDDDDNEGSVKNG